MKMQWKRRAKTARRAFKTGVIETDEQRIAREDAERIASACAGGGAWWPPSHRGDWLPWDR